MNKEIVNFEGKSYKKEVLYGGGIKLTPFEYSWGDVFKTTKGSLYILVQSELRRGNLVSLIGGNRYSDDYAGTKEQVVSKIIANKGFEYVGRLSSSDITFE